MNSKAFIDWFAYVAVRVVICIIQAMRIETCHAIARAASVLLNDIVRLRGAVVDDNLRNVFPTLSDAERHRISGQMWEHLLLMVCEIAHAPRKIHRGNWRDHITFRGRREIVQCLIDPRPTVLVTGHFGNFELGGFITGLLGFPSFTVARRLIIDTWTVTSTASVARMASSSCPSKEVQRKSKRCSTVAASCRYWVINMRARKVAGASSSVDRHPATRQSPCFR